MSVCRTIGVSVQQVWLIAIQGKMLLHISVQCRTDMQLLPHLGTRKPQNLFCNFPTCSLNTLHVRCWYYSFQEDAWFPTILPQPSLFPIHRNTTPCNTLS